MRKLILLPCLFLFTNKAFSQTDAELAHQKRYEQQIGVQANELIRQIFNFSGNNTNTANANPYLLVYHINSRKSGFGLRIGLGYNYQDFTNDDGITRQETTLNDFRGRLGVEKMFRISPKWTTGVGVDAVMNYNNDYTKSGIRSFDTTTTITTTRITSYGGGGMGWLRYQVSPHILLGTETSFYYSTGKEKDEINITKREFNGGSNNPLITTTATVDNNRSDGKFSVPVAFYLIVQF